MMLDALMIASSASLSIIDTWSATNLPAPFLSLSADKLTCTHSGAQSAKTVGASHYIAQGSGSPRYAEVNIAFNTGTNTAFNSILGMGNSSFTLLSTFRPGDDAAGNSRGLNLFNGKTRFQNIESNYSTGITTTGTYNIGILFNPSTGTVAFYRSGASLGTAWTFGAGSYTIFLSSYYTGDSAVINCGSSAFTQTPPAGTLSWDGQQSF